MKKSVFNNDKLSLYDKISTIVYFLLTIMVSKIELFFKDIETQRSIISSYSFLTPFLLYTLSYKSLRNIKMLIIWIGFSVYHLFLFKSLIVNYDLMSVRRHAAHGLQYTIHFVILFEILRIGHLKLFGYELVSLEGSGARTDLFDNRKIRLPDIICFFIYFLIWLFTAILK